MSPKFPPDTGTFDLNDDSYAEFHFVLDLSGADAGHQYTFQLYNITAGATVGVAACQITVVSNPPSMALNTADEHAFSTSTPTLEMIGTDPDGDDIRYLVQIHETDLSWTEPRPGGDASYFWWGCGVDGDNMIVCSRDTTLNSGRIYSYNGLSWSEEQPAGNTDQYWVSVGISGTKMITCADSGRLYSYNGSSWSEQTPEAPPI